MRHSLLPTLLGALWVVAVLVFIGATSARMRKGQWRVHRSRGLVWFDSDLGRFGFDSAGRFHAQTHDVLERTIPLDQILGVRFSYERRTSREALEEFDVLRGLRSPWFDILDRYEIALVTARGNLSVFVAGQAFRQVPVIGRLVNPLVDVFDRRGWMFDVEAHASAALDELRQEFARRGHPLPLL